MADDVLVVHQGLALMLCEDAGILEETLKAIKDLTIHIRRLGDRALLVPATEIDSILQILQREGIFPHVTGSASLASSASDPQDEPLTEEAL